MTYIILSNAEMVKVPEGADPDAVRRMNERRLAREAQPTKTTRHYSTRHAPRTGKREQQYRAQAALTNGFLAAIERAQEEITE
jgi:hypothetical protein